MKTKTILECNNQDSEINIKLLPRSSVNQIIGLENNVYKIKVTSPPVDGKANKSLINILSKQLGIAKGKIEITSGTISRNKKVKIKGLSKVEIAQKLGGYSP